MRIKGNDVLIVYQILLTSKKKYKENSEENVDVNIGSYL